MRAVHQQFQGRGFEILGLNVDEEAHKARQMVAEKKVAWTQAEYGRLTPSPFVVSGG
jgi:hypothetical protein